MALTIKFQSTGALPGGATEMRMAGASLTIGRGEENDVVLPDPDRHLSKRHCVIEADVNGYVLLDISTNGTFLNRGKDRLGPAPTPLNNGDLVTLGSYEFVVQIEEEAIRANDPFAGIPPPLDDGPVAPGGRGSGEQGGFVSSLDDPSASLEGDFLDDLLGEPSGTGPKSAPARVDPLDQGQDLLPPDDDPFHLGPAPDKDLGDGASEGNHRPTTSDAFVAPGSKNVLIPDDWDEEFAGDPSGADFPAAPDTGVPPSPGGQLIPDDPFAPEDAPPPKPAATPHSRPQPAPQQPPPAATAVNATGARAFLRAAGVERLNVPDEELEQVMTRLGVAFRVMVEGLREVLMTRASIKGEFRINQTMIQSGGNNPLKFSTSPEQAMEAMVRPATPGYIDADAAAIEALKDVKAHEVAMMTGMQTALRALLARVDPKNLTARIETGRALGGLLGGNKKAKYWQLYEQMYAEIASEAEDDFHSLFGKEFARAYQEQLRKL